MKLTGIKLDTLKALVYKPNDCAEAIAALAELAKEQFPAHFPPLAALCDLDIMPGDLVCFHKNKDRPDLFEVIMAKDGLRFRRPGAAHTYTIGDMNSLEYWFIAESCYDRDIKDQMRVLTETIEHRGISEALIYWDEDQLDNLLKTVYLEMK